jgi:hypothetical protein
MDINQLKIIKKLGYGFKGTVYLVKYKNKQYAYKIEKILKENIKFIKTEIDFSLKFANKYNNQFIKLYKYDIIKNCKHIQKIDTSLKLLPFNVVNKIQKLRKSNYCFIRLYSLVDTTLDKIENKLSPKQIYSMLIQLSYINYLLDKNKYLYGDMNLNNIGVVKTTKKNIKILNKDVPTFGYIFKLIDFGTVNKYKGKKEYFELNQVINFYLINYKKLYNKIEEENIKYNYEKIFNKISKTDEYKLLENYTKDDSLKYTLFTIIYPKKYQKIILKNKFKKVIFPKLRCSIKDIIFLIKNKNNIKNIIKYFTEKIKE